VRVRELPNPRFVVIKLQSHILLGIRGRRERQREGEPRTRRRDVGPAGFVLREGQPVIFRSLRCQMVK